MKKVLYIVNGVLVIAVIVLFILFFSKGNGSVNDNSIVRSFSLSGKDSSAYLPIAYVNVDSLLENYNFAKESNDKLIDKFNTLNNTLTSSKKRFDSDLADFQKKVQNNVFLSQDRAEQEAAKIRKKGDDLQRRSNQLQLEFTTEQQKMYQEMADSVTSCLKDFNKKAKFHIIFSNKGLNNVLLANPRYNITSDVLRMLNQRYDASKKK